MRPAPSVATRISEPLFEKREQFGLAHAVEAERAELAAEFISLKKMEWIEYSRHVSDWETSRYVEGF